MTETPQVPPALQMPNMKDHEVAFAHDDVVICFD